MRITPCSADCGGRRSKRWSSRSACLSACSGRSAASICSRSSLGLGLLLVDLAELLLDRLELLAQEELALALVDLGLDLRLDLRADRDQLQLAREQLGQAAQPLAHVALLEQLLVLLGLDPQRAGDHVRELRRVLEVGHRDLELLGQVGHLLDDLEKVVCTLRKSASSSARVGTTSGSSSMRATR